MLRVMTADASTARIGQAKTRQESVGQAMIRIFMIVVAAGLVILGAITVYVGLNPPNPTPHTVEKQLPTDKFPSR
jgi:hypothetical protein